MPPQDRIPITKISEEEEKPLHGDPSENLMPVDWVKGGKDKESTSKVQLAMADGNGEGAHKLPSPFQGREGDPAPKPVEQAKPADQPKPVEQAKPVEQPKPADQTKPADQPKPPSEALKAPEPPFAKELPSGAIDATQRAFQAFADTKPGQPLTPEQRKAFDDALKDANKIDSKWAQDQEKKLVDDLQNRERKLPNGAVLPPWTVEKENQFVDKMVASQKKFSELPPEAQKKIADMEANINRLAPTDTIRRGVFQRLLNEEGNKDPKIKEYLSAKNELDTFTKDNAAGIVRRSMHQQDMSVLHSKSICAGIYAIALDKAGQPGDQKQIQTLLKDSISDRFAPANIPEIVGLVDKYKLEEKDNQDLDKKIPGRADLRHALELMNDEKQGSAAERLEKARPFFEKAIGASATIDQKATLDEIDKVGKERNAQGENCPPDKLNELEARAVELVQKATLPFEARKQFAIALHNASVDSKDPALNEQAIGLLRAAEKLDPAYELNPVLQGALLLAQKNPAEKFDEKKAEEAGKPEVERRKEELVKQGKNPDDRPAWLKALIVGGETLAGAAAFHLIGKYIFGPMGTAKDYLRRSWELSSRLKNVGTESTPSLAPGEEPKLMYKNKDGKEMPVDGVRKADGKLRVWDGDKTELVKLGKGDSLYLKVPPDAKLTPEQVREIAAKKLTPTGDEQVINENRQHRDLEIEQMKRAQDELQRKLEQAENKTGATDLVNKGVLPDARVEVAPGVAVGDEVKLGGEAWIAKGTQEGKSILYKEGRGQDSAGEFQILEGKPDPQKYKELPHFDGQAKNVRYYSDKEGQVFKVSDGKIMTTAYDVMLADPKAVAAAGPTARPPQPEAKVADSKTLDKPAVEPPRDGQARPERIVPTADKVQGTDTRVGTDGTLERKDARPGEVLAREQLERRSRVEQKEIDALRANAEELAKSDKQADREKAEVLKKTVDALEGRLGVEAQDFAHRAVLAESRQALERGEGGGYGRAVTGGLIGIGILAAAALAYYRSTQKDSTEKPLDRAKVK